MAYSIRCRNSACRHRRVVTTHPDDYKRTPRCPSCGELRGWRIEKRQYARRNRCYCSGYHHPHQRATSKYCDHHPQGFYNQAVRAGVSDADIPLDHMPHTVSDGSVPF